MAQFSMLLISLWLIPGFQITFQLLISLPKLLPLSWAFHLENSPFWKGDRTEEGC